MAQLKRTVKLGVSLIVRGFDAVAEAFTRIIGRPLPGRCVVLYYHAVPAAQRSLFSGQMDVLLKLAIPLSTHPTATLAPGQRYVMVTFDDGFLSVRENALPELRKRRIPWTIFVPSGCLGHSPAWLKHARSEAAADRVMTAEELRALADDPLVTVGSHTVSHVNLAETPIARARGELFESKRELEAAIGRPVRHFSYPFGGRTPELDQQAGEAGYVRLFSSEPSCAEGSADAFLTGRISVDPDNWPLEFRLKVLGAYRWGAWLQSAKRRMKSSRPPAPSVRSTVAAR